MRIAALSQIKPNGLMAYRIERVGEPRRKAVASCAGHVHINIDASACPGAAEP